MYGMVIPTCESTLRQVEILSSLASQPQQIDIFQVSERPCFKNAVNGTRGITLQIGLWPPYVHTRSTYIQAGTRVHTLRVPRDPSQTNVGNKTATLPTSL